MSEGPTIRSRSPLLTALVIVIAILLLGFLLTRFYNLPIPRPQVSPASNVDVKQTQVDPTKLPETFPADIPLESGAVVTQNYNATTSGVNSNASFQATREFQSKKTVDENYKLYTDFFQSSGWAIKTSFEDVSIKSITAQKGTTQVTVHIDQNKVTGQVTVNITATQAPAFGN